MSKFHNPWEQEKLVLVSSLSMNTSRNCKYPAYHNFKLFPLLESEENYKKGKLERKVKKGHFTHIAQPCYIFSSFPIEDEGLMPLLWMDYFVKI